MKTLLHFPMKRTGKDVSTSVFSNAILFVLSLLLSTNVAMAQTHVKSTREMVDLPAEPGYTLRPGFMYMVRHDMTLDANTVAGALNGLNVTAAGSGQDPILYIPNGVTLTVKGTNGNGAVAGGAGIYVPQGTHLIVTGFGKLIAEGGDAGNGGDGLTGENPGGRSAALDFAFWVANTGGPEFPGMPRSGSGGHGGNGGGGAGAAIGGIGGNGGNGGNGAGYVSFTGPSTSGLYAQYDNVRENGKNGSNGEVGQNGTAMGRVSIMGHITLNAVPGKVGKAGKGGNQGYTIMQRQYGGDYQHVAGAGGGGGGGGAGYTTTNAIGGGAAGAGGGAGGGGGAIDYLRTTSQQRLSANNASCRASSGTGGKGAVSGTDGSNTRQRDTGSQQNNWPAVGGQGGKGANGGVAGGKGSLFVGPHAHVTDGTNERFSDYGAEEPIDIYIGFIAMTNEYGATNATSGDFSKGAQVGEIEAQIGEELPGAATAQYKLAAKAQTSPEKFESEDKYFAGYYTSDKGVGERIYKGFGDTNLEGKMMEVAFAKDQTMYAHFVHVHHILNWDYCYSDGGMVTPGSSTWKNLNHSEYLGQGKLGFYSFNENGERILIKEVTMTAYNKNMDEATADAQDKTFIYKYTPAAGLLNHTRAQGDIRLMVGTTADQLNSEDPINIYFTDDELVTFASYTFTPWDGVEKPKNWETIVDTENHQTVFSFTGAKDGGFTQSWEVTLLGLKVYPEEVFAKPLYKNTSNEWALISQLPAKYDGVVCSNPTPVMEGDEIIGYTYKGGYPVWKEDGEGHEYQYKVGLVGFKLGGVKYYMDEHHGEVHHEDMQSPNTYEGANNIGQYFGGSPIVIKFDVEASNIAVLRLMPNGGTLAEGTPAIMVNESRTGTFSLVGCSAVRSGYKLMIWNTEANGTGDEYELDCTTVPGTGAITLYAQWQETTPPAVALVDVTYPTDTKATVVVAVTDASGVATVKYYYSDTEVDPESITEWTAATPGTGNLYGCDVDNKPYAYVYVKAVDIYGNETIQPLGKIKTDNLAPVASIYPTGNVCNYDCQIEVTDNIKIGKIMIKRPGSDEYVEVDASEITKTSDTQWSYTLHKPTTSDEEGVYSLKVIDEAGNETVYEEFIHMYKDHDFSDGAHDPIDPTDVDDGWLYKYWNCTHHCGHVWVEEICGGTPDDPTDGYKHESTKTDPTEKEHQEQGLMRDEVPDIFLPAGSVLVKTEDGDVTFTRAGLPTVNEALQFIVDNPDGRAEDVEWVKLTDFSNVDENTSVKAFVDPGKAITLNLNGKGFYVGGKACEEGITGCPNITILLRDGQNRHEEWLHYSAEEGDVYGPVSDNIPYANPSKVVGSPIKYTRTFSEVQDKHWQAILLPFDAKTPATGLMGDLNKVELTKESANLYINKWDDGAERTLEAFKPYFIKHGSGSLEIVSTSDNVLEGYSKEAIKEKEIPGSDYKIAGSLKAISIPEREIEEIDLQAKGEKSFWVLTNGGRFKWMNDGQVQRPYRWAILGSPMETPAEIQARGLELFEIDPTAIEDVKVIETGDEDVYSVSGVKMPKGAKLQNGVYISGGKKFYVK